MGSRIEEKREKYRRYAEKIRIFNGLPPEYVHRIVHAGEAAVYQQGAIVVREGAPCNAMLIIFKGQLSLYERGVFLGKRGAGESCCEFGVLHHNFLSPTAVADMETKVLALETHTLQKLLEDNVGKQLLLNVAQVLGERGIADRERIIRLHNALKEHDTAASDRIAQHAFEPKAKPSLT